MSRRLALFDLDNTLLAGDSDHAFGEYLIDAGLVEAESHRAANDRFYSDYEAGVLNIHDYVRFTLGPVLEMDEAQRARLQRDFSTGLVDKLVTPASRELVSTHRDAGDYILIITATNEYVTELIARSFEVDRLIATELECQEGRFTGDIAGIPCYQEGKVKKLEQWLEGEGDELGLSLEHSIFYSDSVNDLPLLERAGEPVVVDADPRLTEIARTRGWRQLALNREPRDQQS